MPIKSVGAIQCSNCQKTVGIGTFTIEPGDLRAGVSVIKGLLYMLGVAHHIKNRVGGEGQPHHNHMTIVSLRTVVGTFFANSASAQARIDIIDPEIQQLMNEEMLSLRQENELRRRGRKE